LSTNYYKLGLIGYPVKHSYSEILHTTALNAFDLDGEYRLYEIPPLPEGSKELNALIEMMRQGEIGGLNVTIPHKRSIIQFLDELTSTSRVIGAVNTVFSNNGIITGTNTDADGFLIDLAKLLNGYIQIDLWKNGCRTNKTQALILGAGGAARAVAFALLGVGWDISIAARNLEQARILVDELNQYFKNNNFRALELSYSGLSDIRLEYTLVVNATAAGMHPDVMINPWPGRMRLPENCFVYDLVYNPANTELLKQAQEEKIPASGGIGMLIEQAALSFQIWTGLHISRGVLYESVKDIS